MHARLLLREALRVSRIIPLFIGTVKHLVTNGVVDQKADQGDCDGGIISLVFSRQGTCEIGKFVV